MAFNLDDTLEQSFRERRERERERECVRMRSYSGTGTSGAGVGGGGSEWKIGSQEHGECPGIFTSHHSSVEFVLLPGVAWLGGAQN